MNRTMPTIPNPSNAAATTLALSIAPVATGAAVGLLVAETLGRESRRNASLMLFGVAALAAVPYLAHHVTQLVKGPNSRIGARRTIANIRDGGLDYDYTGYNFDELETEDLPPVPH